MVEGIKKIEGKYYNCGGGNKKNGGGKRGKKNGGGKRGKKNIACFLWLF